MASSNYVSSLKLEKDWIAVKSLLKVQFLDEVGSWIFFIVIDSNCTWRVRAIRSLLNHGFPFWDWWSHLMTLQVRFMNHYINRFLLIKHICSIWYIKQLWCSEELYINCIKCSTYLWMTVSAQALRCARYYHWIAH